MQPCRALLLLILTPLALGGCWFPGGPPPEPEVVQEAEPNNTTLQANELPLAPDSFSGTVATVAAAFGCAVDGERRRRRLLDVHPDGGWGAGGRGRSPAAISPC